MKQSTFDICFILQTFVLSTKDCSFIVMTKNDSINDKVSKYSWTEKPIKVHELSGIQNAVNFHGRSGGYCSGFFVSQNRIEYLDHGPLNAWFALERSQSLNYHAISHRMSK